MFAGFFMSLRQQDFRVRRCWETRLKFRLERMVWQKGSRGVSSRPMPFSERGSRRKRIWEQIRSRLGADSVVSGTMFADKYGICIVRQPQVLETSFFQDVQNIEFVFQLYQLVFQLYQY